MYLSTSMIPCGISETILTGPLKVVYDQFSLDSYYPEFEDFYRTYSEKKCRTLESLPPRSSYTRRIDCRTFPLSAAKTGRLQSRHHTATQSGLPLGTFRAGRPAFLCPRTSGIFIAALHAYPAEQRVQGGCSTGKSTTRGLRPFFDQIILSDEVGYLKPHPRNLYLCAQSPLGNTLFGPS